MGKKQSIINSNKSELVAACGTFAPLVFVARIPEGRELGTAVPERQREIDAVSNPSVKRERYWSWRLLERAIRDTVGATPDEIGVRRGDHGGLVSDGIFISVSHSTNAVAVALSPESVGVDLEELGRGHREKLAERYLVGGELAVWESGREGDPEGTFLRLWCAKEAAFKSLGERIFIPSAIDSTMYKTRCERMELDELSLMLAIASPGCDEAEIRIIDLAE